MPADANGSTSSLLASAADFAAPGASMDPRLFFDVHRRVLELLPRPPVRPTEPLSGLAIDGDGTVFRADPEGRRLLVYACDGSERPMALEPGALLSVAGLALDARGLLYVCDPVARRVLVVAPSDAAVVAVLGRPLVEPVDVAVGLDGRLLVADREAGKVVLFSPAFAPCGELVPRTALGLPRRPRPVGVAVAADGGLLVADAEFPRLLAFDARLAPRADVPVTSAVAALDAEGLGEGSLAWAWAEASLHGCPPERTAPLTRAPGPLPRFVVPRERPLPDWDGLRRLAAVHRALRFVRLRLGRAFETCGDFVSAALDSGRPGTVWHRVELEVQLPGESWLKVQTRTSEDGLSFGPWLPEEDPSCTARPATVPVFDRLVLSAPGRYLQLRLQLGGDGQATPSVGRIKVVHPRYSYLDLLPRAYRMDADAASFLERYLALVERVLTGVEDRYERFSRELNPDAAPREVLDWLAALVDLTFDPSWPTERRRAVLAEAMDLYRRRGTVRGLERFVELYVGQRPVILEEARVRPVEPPVMGGGALLGVMGLWSVGAAAGAREAASARTAHRFTVLVPVFDACDEAGVLAAVERIVTMNKPAHTVHRLVPLRADARVGAQATVGVDLVLGTRTPPSLQLGGCPEPGEASRTGSTLGVDSVVGDRRPFFLHPRPERS